jgi:hypothetical protein
VITCPNVEWAHEDYWATRQACLENELINKLARGQLSNVAHGNRS